MKKLLLFIFAFAISFPAFAQNSVPQKSDTKVNRWTQNITKKQTGSVENHLFGFKNRANVSATQRQNAPAQTAYTWTDISIPFNQNVTFTQADVQQITIPDNGAVVPVGLKFYKFTLSEATALQFTSGGAAVAFIVFDHEPADIIMEDPIAYQYNLVVSLEAGTYWVLFNFPYDAALPFNAQIGINAVSYTFYYDLDYSSTLTLNNLQMVSASSFTPNVALDEVELDNIFNAAGYTFAAEAGHTYKLDIHFLFSDEVYGAAGAFILQNNLTQNIYYDLISSNGDEVESNYFSTTAYFTAENTENVKILLAYIIEGFVDGVSASIKITETGSPQTAITLPELLAAAPEIQYASLPFTVTGTFGANTPLVQGDSENFNFRYNDGNYYAVAYKMNLMAGQTIKIHEHSSGDAYLYIYKKVGGSYVYVDENDDWYDGVYSYDWHGNDSYIETIISETGEYYAVATNYKSANEGGTGAFYLTIWNTPTEPEVVLPVIVATTPSVEFINVALDVTELDIRMALMSLVTLTATDNNQETFEIENNPMAWEILETVIPEFYGTAFYSNTALLTNYEFAANYQPAQVTIIKTTSGLDNINASKLALYPNPAVEFVSVSGLNGGENLSIINLNGQILSSVKAGGSTQTMSVTGLTRGIYLIAVQNGKKLTALKFVK
jgi:hypothetical protein